MSDVSLRVLFDTEIFGQQLHGGISRYYAELIRHLPHHGVEPVLIAPLTFNQHLMPLQTPGFVGVRAPGALRNRHTVRAVHHFLRLADEVSSRVLKYSLLHHTYYNRRLDVQVPQVTTVVDMIPERFPELFPGGNPHGAKESAARASRLVFTISECTRRDLLAFYPQLEARVVVTHLAVDQDFFRSRARGEEDGTILFVGDRGGYKNFATFARAAARLLAERPELRVLCVGGSPLQEHERVPFEEQGVSARLERRTATDEELPSIYRRATAFVFPSKYEGFGLPILEAFASGCPVVLSNASCFPEVADDAASYFDPSSSDELLETLRRVTCDSAYRSELRRRGGNRVNDFTWDRTAERTSAAYHDLVASSH